MAARGTSTALGEERQDGRGWKEGEGLERVDRMGVAE